MQAFCDWKSKQTDVTPAIECLDWKPLRYSLPNVDRHQQFFMKLRFEQTSEYVLHMWITDFKSVWEEKLRKKEYIAKMKRLNPNLDGDPMNLIQKIAATISGEIESSVSVISLQPLELQYETVAGGLPVVWNFNGVAWNFDEFFENVTMPLIVSNAFANFKVNRLVDLCKRKDAEIEDYVQSRGKLSRPSLATPKTTAFLTELETQTIKVPQGFCPVPDVSSILECKFCFDSFMNHAEILLDLLNSDSFKAVFAVCGAMQAYQKSGGTLQGPIDTQPLEQGSDSDASPSKKSKYSVKPTNTKSRADEDERRRRQALESRLAEEAKKKENKREKKKLKL